MKGNQTTLKQYLTLGLLGLLAMFGVACSIGPLTPTSTVTPTPVPAPTPAGIIGDIAFGHVGDLSVKLGPRESGTDQERAAADYLASQFEAMGYSVEAQTFAVEALAVDHTGLTLEEPGRENIKAIPLAMSAYGDASGVLLPVGLGTEENIPEGGLTGKIALVKRGQISFSDKVNRAAAAGATGAVIYNNEPGNFQGALRISSTIPAISISQEDGEMIEKMASRGQVVGTISIKTVTHISRNVIVEKPGPSTKVVVLGAHYDTVPGVPGANDNASGTAVILALARELSGRSFPFRLRFIAFGSEELGLKGSQFYVSSLSDEEQGQIIAMFNFDALGSGNRLGILGNQELTDLVVENGKERGIDVEVSLGLTGGSSDHASFGRVGVPVIAFFSDDFSRLHTPDDTLESINPSLLGDVARLALALLGSPDFGKKEVGG